MAIYKRPGKSEFYWTRFTFNGREIRQSTKTANKRSAEAFEAALRTQLALGRIGMDQLGNKAAKPFSFIDAMADFLANFEKKDSTLRRYETGSKALISFFASTPVTSIETADVERFRARRKNERKKPPHTVLRKNPKARLDKPIRPATVNRELMLLSGLFKWLIRTGKATKNPVTGITFLREENDVDRVVTEAEYRAYIMAASQPLQDVAQLVYETGMRPGEVFSLRKDDIDFEQKRIIIRTGKTDAARRRLTMSETAERVLADRYEQAKSELLFPGGKSGDSESPIVKLTNAHNAAITRAGLKPFRLYDLRHTFATALTQSGVDLMTVKAILGHSRLEMVTRYSHPTEGHQADAIARLAAFRNKPTNIRAFSQRA